ncbi:MAG: hypothetical protein HY000_06735 [Planctomycetes bacterium]|nr:hypothetical protein [Planctomycetota bacterium]
MQEFYGDLLIGGMRLAQVRGELEEEQPQPNSREWLLAGRLHLSPEQMDLIEIDRPYRLQLDDGRAGQVVVSRIARPRDDELLVAFQPKRAAVVAPPLPR